MPEALDAVVAGNLAVDSNAYLSGGDIDLAVKAVFAEKRLGAKHGGPA